MFYIGGIFFKTCDELQDFGHNVMLYKDDVPNVEVGVGWIGFTRKPVVPSALPTGRAAMTMHRGVTARRGAPRRHRLVRGEPP